MAKSKKPLVLRFQGIKIQDKPPKNKKIRNYRPKQNLRQEIVHEKTS